MITADFHCHTNFSTDSDCSPEAIIEKAISLGLKSLCITDHMDYLFPSGQMEEFVFHPDDYFAKLCALREELRSKITLFIGIELGLRNEPAIKEEVRAYYHRLLKTYPFDFVIGSTHILEYMDPYEASYWNLKTSADGLQDYFQSIYDNSRYYDDFDVYGHLDYIVRYLPSKSKNYSYLDYQDIISLLLQALLQKGKGIECNSAGLKYKLGFPHPKSEILQRYKELGGEILTIGSDGHQPEHLAYDFKTVQEYLSSIGFRYYTIFEQRTPKNLPLL